MEHSETRHEDSEAAKTPEKKQPNMPSTKVLQRYIPILVVNIIFILIMSYFISPWSKVDTVSVEGNKAVYDQTIINHSSIRGGDSIVDLLKNTETIEKNIQKQLPQVSKTKVKLAGMNDVVIQVEEYETVAYIANEAAYLRVLENGKVLDDAYNISLGNQPVLSNFKEGKALNLMIKQLSQLDTPTLNLISEIELVDDATNPLLVQAFMNNGSRVLSSIPDFSEKMPYYPQMVEAVSGQKGVFDMEVGVYFIPFSNEQELDVDTEVDESNRQPVEGFSDQ